MFVELEDDRDNSGQFQPFITIMLDYSVGYYNYYS